MLQVSSEMAFSKSNKGRLFKPGQPLSEEFRLNIISKLLDGGANEETGFVPRGIKSKVALELLIDKHCVSRAWESWITNRDVRSRPKGSQGCGKLHQNDLHYIEFLKRETPSITLRDIQEKLNTFSNKNVHLATICRALKRSMPSGEFTRKRLTRYAKERFSYNNLQYTEAVMQYLSQKEAHRINFFDEAGFNSRDCNPIYGHALRGVKAVEVCKYTNIPEHRKRWIIRPSWIF